MKKLLLSLAVLLAVVLVPVASLSKESAPSTILLTSDNLLVLSGEVNGDSVGAVIRDAKELDAKMTGRFGNHTTPLYLYINSPGGSIISGMEMIEALKGLGRPVNTITAFGASMAFQVSQALDKRYVTKSGIMMSHRAAGQIQGSFGGTAPSQMDSRYHLWLQITKELDEVAVARTNGRQTLESYQKSYANEMWLTGQESIAGGYADEITKVKCGKGLEGNNKHTVEFFGLQVEYETDKCPINTSPMNAKVHAPVGFSSEYVDKILNQFLSGYQMKLSSPLPMVL